MLQLNSKKIRKSLSVLDDYLWFLTNPPNDGDYEFIKAVTERLERLVTRLNRWITLHSPEKSNMSVKEVEYK